MIDNVTDSVSLRGSDSWPGSALKYGISCTKTHYHQCGQPPDDSPKQIQPGARFPRRELTQHQHQSQGGRQPLVRVDTEPFLLGGGEGGAVEAGPAPSRWAVLFQIDDRVHPGNVQPLVSSPPQQGPGSLIPTPHCHSKWILTLAEGARNFL